MLSASTPVAPFSPPHEPPTHRSDGVVCVADWLLAWRRDWGDAPDGCGRSGVRAAPSRAFVSVTVAAGRQRSDCARACGRSLRAASERAAGKLQHTLRLYVCHMSIGASGNVHGAVWVRCYGPVGRLKPLKLTILRGDFGGFKSVTVTNNPARGRRTLVK